MYRLQQDLSLGVDTPPLASDVNPLVNWRPISGDAEPASAVVRDLVGPDWYGTAYYATPSKDLEPHLKLPGSVYVSALYRSFDDEFVYPFGATFRLGR